MKTIVGVDLAEHYASALETCLELDFPNQEFLFVHAVEPLPSYAPPMTETFHDGAAWMQHLRRAGQVAVTKAEARTCHHHITSSSLIVDGPAASNLISAAEAHTADLVAVGTVRRSGLGSFVAGSVARALAIGAKQSILVTKEDRLPKRPLHAVFATDHSEYANRALNRLLGWAPKGVTQIDLITAYDIDDMQVKATPDNLLQPVADIEKAMTGHLIEKGEEVIRMLARAGYTSELHVLRGSPAKILGEHMKKSEADLLILGAQGHGFFERLMVGSTALQQVISAPYPVLVIRP
jgi:nucleotide-binding universal stress UspA family protein